MRDLSRRERRWFKQNDRGEVANLLFSETARIDNESNDRLEDYLKGCALYGDRRSWPGVIGLEPVSSIGRRVGHNVCATAIDALVAEVTQGVPRPMAITIGGTYGERRKAQKITAALDAKFDERNVHELGRRAVLDSCLFGLGILRSFRSNPLNPKNDSTDVERVFPPFCLVDDKGAVDTTPREFYIRHFVDKWYLCEKFPKYKSIIEQSSGPRQHFWFGSNSQQDIVEVVEGWHLKSGPDGKDGRYVMATDKGCIHFKHYDWEDFPLAFVRAVPAVHGFWPSALILRAAPAQLELNKLLRRIQEAMHLVSVPRVYMKRGSGIVKAHFQNNIGVIIEHDGDPPYIATAPAMSNDVFSHIRTLEEWIYKELGISELSANSRKPPGLDSGAALRTYNDVQSRRWINLERSYEDMHKTLARHIIRYEKEIADEYPEHEIAFTHRKFVKSTKWKDIELPENRLGVRLFSSSALPNTPWGKLQSLSDMLKLQAIDQKQFLKLADIPDFESIRDLIVAPEELLEDMFDDMLDGGDYRAPEPHMDLEGGRILASLMMQRAEKLGATPADLEKLITWVGASMKLEAQMAKWAQAEMQLEQMSEQAQAQQNGVAAAQQGVQQMQQAQQQVQQLPPGPANVTQLRTQMPQTPMNAVHIE